MSFVLLQSVKTAAQLPALPATELCIVGMQDLVLLQVIHPGEILTTLGTVIGFFS